jgi:hypothetical protein
MFWREEGGYKICQVCKKKFWVPNLEMYVFKEKLPRTVYYCGWTCKRKAEAIREARRKKALEEKKPGMVELDRETLLRLIAQTGKGMQTLSVAQGHGRDWMGRIIRTTCRVKPATVNELAKALKCDPGLLLKKEVGG